MADKQKVTRKLRAILSADVKEYSRLMSDDESYTIQTLKAYQNIMTAIIEKHSGRVVDTPGDNLLAEFSSIVNAVQSAVEIQTALKQENTVIPIDKKLEFRIGVNIGDVIQDGERLYGDGVNIAARIEGLADPGGVCISRGAYDHIRNKLKLGYEYIGEHSVKNIKHPVRIYKLLMEPADAGKLIGDEPKPLMKPGTWASVIIAAIVLILIGYQVFQKMTIPEFEPASIENMSLPLPDKPSIAVLPFDNMSGDKEQEYFSDGITENIISSLSKTEKLFVISRNSTFVYKGKPVRIRQVAEELGVRYVLEGSVQKSKDQVRITAQLIDAIEGNHLWAERYDSDLKNIFVLQDEITMKIATALQIKLTDGEQFRMMCKPNERLDVMLKFMEGRSLWAKGDRKSHIQFGSVAQEIIDMAPESVIGYRMLAWHYWGLARTGQAPKESIGKAFKLAQKALSMDESDPSTHVLLGGVYLQMRKYKKAIAAGKRSIEVAPNSAMAHGLLGITLSYAERVDEAIGYLKQGIRLNPFPEYWNFYHLGRCYRMKGQYKDALMATKKAIHLAPNSRGVYIALVVIYTLSGQQEEASTAAKKILELDPNFSVERTSKASPYKNPADLKLVVDAMVKAGLPYKPPIQVPEKPSIAVLPFDNMSGDPKQEYFSDGLTEEIITALAKIPEMYVIARNSSFIYKGKPVKVQQVAKELGVKYVLEGSVRKDKDNVRVTAQLIDALTGHHLWAERYDRNLTDIFAIQDEITMKILGAMEIKLSEGEQTLLWKKGTNNLNVYLKLLQGIHYAQNINPENNLKAQHIFKEIISIEPDYATAFMALAITHLTDVWLGTTKSPKGSLEKAADLAKKALSIDESQGRAYSILAYAITMKKSWEKGVQLAYKSVELSPNSASALRTLGELLCFADRPKEAIPILEKSIRLNPIAPALYLNAMAIAHRMLQQYDKAIEYLEDGIKRYPNNLFLHLNLSACYFLAGREQKAYEESEKVYKINPKFSIDQFGKTLPLKNQEEKNRFIGALREAGFN